MSCPRERIPNRTEGVVGVGVKMTALADYSLPSTERNAKKAAKKMRTLSARKRNLQATDATPEASERRVRFAPKSGHVRCKDKCPLWANSGHRACHSINSSARERSEYGIARPKALAVLRLIINSNLAGCSTGRSAGFAPLNILSM